MKSIVSASSDQEINSRRINTEPVCGTLRRVRSQPVKQHAIGGVRLLPTQAVQLVELNANEYLRPDWDDDFESKRPWRHQLEPEQPFRFSDYMESICWGRLLDECLCGRQAAQRLPEGHERSVYHRRQRRLLSNALLREATSRAALQASEHFSATTSLAYALAYHPCAEVLATGNQEGQVRLIDVDTAVRAADSVSSLALDQPRRDCYLEGQSLITFWNSAERNRAVFDIAWLDDTLAPSSALASAHASGVIDVVDVSTCTSLGRKNGARGWNRDWRHFQDHGGDEAPSPPVRIARLSGHHGAVRNISPLPASGGQIIATCGRDGNIFVYDLRSCRRQPSAANTGHGEQADRRNALLPVRSVQLGHFRDAKGRQLVERGMASRAQLLAASPDRAVASVAWLSPDPSALLSAGATDGLVKLWDLRQASSFGAFLRPEHDGGSLHALRQLAKPLISVRLSPGAGIAHAHFQRSCNRLTVGTLHPGAPDRGSIFIIDPLQLGNERLSNGVLQCVQAPLWSHYARVRMNPDGSQVAFGSGCDLVVVDLAAIPSSWTLPPSQTEIDSSCLQECPYFRIACTGEVTGLDWSHSAAMRIASLADLEPVRITQSITDWEQASSHPVERSIRISYANPVHHHSRCFSQQRAPCSPDRPRTVLSGQQQRPGVLPCRCCPASGLEITQTADRPACPRCIHEHFCAVPTVSGTHHTVPRRSR